MTLAIGIAVTVGVVAGVVVAVNKILVPLIVLRLLTPRGLSRR
jgi:hypothetical protein